jgi:hypothetical protein
LSESFQLIGFFELSVGGRGGDGVLLLLLLLLLLVLASLPLALPLLSSLPEPDEPDGVNGHGMVDSV